MAAPLNSSQKERLVESLADTAQNDDGFLRDVVRHYVETWDFDDYLDHFGGVDPLDQREED